MKHGARSESSYEIYTREAFVTHSLIQRREKEKEKEKERKRTKEKKKSYRQIAFSPSPSPSLPPSSLRAVACGPQRAGQDPCGSPRRRSAAPRPRRGGRRPGGRRRRRAGRPQSPAADIAARPARCAAPAAAQALRSSSSSSSPCAMPTAPAAAAGMPGSGAGSGLGPGVRGRASGALSGRRSGGGSAGVRQEHGKGACCRAGQGGERGAHAVFETEGNGTRGKRVGIQSASMRSPSETAETQPKQRALAMAPGAPPMLSSSSGLRARVQPAGRQDEGVEGRKQQAAGRWRLRNRIPCDNNTCGAAPFPYAQASGAAAVACVLTARPGDDAHMPAIVREGSLCMKKGRKSEISASPFTPLPLHRSLPLLSLSPPPSIPSHSSMKLTLRALLLLALVAAAAVAAPVASDDDDDTALDALDGDATSAPTQSATSTAAEEQSSMSEPEDYSRWAKSAARGRAAAARAEREPRSIAAIGRLGSFAAAPRRSVAAVLGEREGKREQAAQCSGGCALWSLREDEQGRETNSQPT